MKLTSYGAALEVTGSQHILEVNGMKILMDCGLFQGHRKLAFEKNIHFKYNPAELDALLISHAHIDHTGNIPHLVKKGFRGTIYCTQATKDLCKVMLEDSAYIQEQDAEYFNRKVKGKKLKMDPIYTQKDVEYAMRFFKAVSYNQPFKLGKNVSVSFHEAGHVLGSSMIYLEIKDDDDGKNKTLIYTGDMGRANLPILQDPHQFKKADYVICESTYGNRKHSPIAEGVPDLGRLINRVIKRGGKVLIPAFAFERTQELVYGLHLLMQKGQIPNTLPIFLDSPLSNRITEIFQKYPDLYDDQLKEDFKGSMNPFMSKQLKYITTSDESKKLNYFVGPCVIIASSGMCEAGRIRHHLRNNIEDPKNAIPVVGYMAENTLGRKIIDGENPVKIFDEMLNVNAEVVVLESFSAHADQNNLDNFLSHIEGLKKVFLVHGEVDQSEAMRLRLKEKYKLEAVVMEPEKPQVL